MYIARVIIGAFLVFSLIHGFRSGRGMHTFKKFAVGDKNFKTATLVATLIATEIGVVITFLHLKHTYMYGLYYSLIVITAMVISNLMMSQWMTIRMQECLEHYSIAESMGMFFGNRIRIITALCGILWCAGIVGVQIQYITTEMHTFLNIEGNLLLYSSLTIFLLYAMRGGVRAVTSTDIVQFITFTTFLLTLIYLVIKHSHIFQAVCQLEGQNIISSLHKKIEWTLSSEDTSRGIPLIIPPLIDPYNIQKFYMAADVWQAKRVFTCATCIIFILISLVSILALLLRVSNPNLEPDTLLYYLLFLYPSDFMYGFAFITILSLVMSTADSSIHSASLLFTNDLAPFLKLSSNNKNQLLQARMAICITGIVTLLLSLYQKDSWNLLLFISSLYVPVIPIPFILAVFGFRPREKSVLWGMGAGLITTISFQYFGLNTYFHTMIALLMHLLFLVGSHYLCSTIDDK